MGLATLVLTPSFINKNPKPLNTAPKILVFPILGGVMLSIDLALWNTAVNTTAAANATLLANTAPLWVALVAWIFLREELSRFFWLGLALTLGGAAVVLGSDFLIHASFGWGDTIAIVAGIFYAGYYLATQRGRQHLNTITYIWWMGLSSSLTLLIISLGLGMPITGYSTQTYLSFLGAALITQVGGYMAMGYALGHLPASVVAPTMIGQPVMTALLAIPFLGEILPLSQWMGGLVVLAGIYLVHHSRRN
jgi:drug/metabolite transporter (DMT)-like permease